MAKQIMQFRYYGEGNPNNYPNNFYTSGNRNYLVHGNIFSEKQCNNITQLGIQARPKTKFYLNNSDYPITIGETGIFEIDLKDSGIINGIRFTSDSIQYYDDQADKTSNADKLLIDIIYEGGNF